MTLNYINSDIFTSLNKGDILLHGCNAQGVMGSGIAAQIKKRYPDCFKVYKNRVPYTKVGSVIWYESDSITIGNCITQAHYGRHPKVQYCSYDGIASCMVKVREYLTDAGKNEVHMPKIGAGLGNGDWNIIAPIVECQLRDFKANVYFL